MRTPVGTMVHFATLIVIAALAACTEGNECVDGSTYLVERGTGNVCTACSQCGVGTFLVQNCRGTHDTSCANISASVHASVIFSEPVAVTVYRRVPGNFRATAISTLLQQMGIQDDPRRIGNVSTSLQGSNVTLEFTILPDRVYWDSFCVQNSSLKFNGIEEITWVSNRASDPLAMIHGVLETHINSSLANANVTVSMGTPRFTALGDGTFATFPYQVVAAGERCGSASAAMTGTSISDLLPTFRQGNPTLFATSTLLIALEPEIIPAGIGPSAAYHAFAAKVAAGSVVIAVSEGVLTTPVQVSTTTLLRDAVVSAIMTTTVPTSTSGSDAADWDWELACIVGGGVIGCLLLTVLTVVCFCRGRGDRLDRLDKILVRPNVQPGPSPLPFQPHRAALMAGPGGSHPAVMAAHMMPQRPGSPGFGGRMPMSLPMMMGYSALPPASPGMPMQPQLQITPQMAPQMAPPADPNPPPRMAPLDQSMGGPTLLNTSFDSSAGPGPQASPIPGPRLPPAPQPGGSMVPSEVGVVMEADALNAHDFDSILWQRNRGSMNSIDEAIADDVDVSGMPANVAVAIVKARRASVKAARK